MFSELGEIFLSTRRKLSGLQELESNLLASILDNLNGEQRESIDGKLLEELVSIAEEREW